jgi:hypothetical protein
VSDRDAFCAEHQAKRVAFWLDRYSWGWRIQPLACLLLGHVYIPAASWYVGAKGNRCAYCGKDDRRGE